MAARRRQRILAIDDTPLNLALLLRALDKEYDVTLLETAEPGLALLKNEIYDLILLDIMMPGMDGFTAFRKIRELPLHADTPIIFLTAADDHSTEKQGLGLGAADFIFKPIRIDLVKLRIKNALRLVQVGIEQKLSEERLRYVMEATGDGIWDWDIASNSVAHNRSWCSMLGLDDACLTHPLEFFADLILPADFPAVQANLYSCLQGSSAYRSEHRLRHADGSHIWVEDRGHVVQRAADGQPIRMVGCIKNIDRRKRDEEEIRRLAFFDTLTELPNRRLFLDRIEQAILRVQRCNQTGALMFIDMDRFKVLNDNHGHAMGDALLIEVGARLQKTVRRQDTIARIGGDEFVALLEGLSGNLQEAAEQASRIADKMLQALNEPYDLPTIIYKSTPSIGLTLFDKRSKTIDEVLGRADSAMYAAKNAGRNTIRTELHPPDATAQPASPADL